MYIEENPICIEDESLGLQYSIYSDVSIVPTKIDIVMSKDKVFYMDISYEFDLSNIEKIDALSEMEMEKRLEEMEGNLLADNFARASLEELIGKEALSAARVFKADYFANAVYINKGGGNYELQALPEPSQYFPIRTFCVADATQGRSPLVLAGGNFYGPTIELGRQDAGQLLLLQAIADNKWNAAFNEPALFRGEIRKIQSIRIKGQTAFILAENNNQLRIIQ